MSIRRLERNTASELDSPGNGDLNRNGGNGRRVANGHAPSRLGAGRQKAILATVVTILFVTFLDNTIVSVILANIQSTLHTGVVALQWIIDGYMLTFAALMLTGGTYGDLFGRKKVMLGGVALFVIGAIVALFAGDSKIVIAGRVIMGIGAAASEPGTLSMLRHIFPDAQHRARAYGVWAAVSGAALALGPIIGGVLIGFWNWRAVFGFSAGFGLLALAAGFVLLPENADPQGRRIDHVGLQLGGASIVTATIGIIQGQTAGFRTWWIILLLAASVIFGVLFALYEKRVTDPVLKIDFFGNSTFTGANIVAFATNFGIFAIFFFSILYLEIMRGFSGFGIAVAFLAMAAAMVLAAAATGRWIAAAGPRMPTVIGCLIAGIGLFIVRAVLGPHITGGTLAWSLAIVGLGFGMTLVTMTSSVLAIVPPERSGMAASTVNTFRELGGVFGVAILGAIVNGQLTQHLTGQLKRLGIPADFRAVVIKAVTHGRAKIGGMSGAARAGTAATRNPLARTGAAHGAATPAAHGAFSPAVQGHLTQMGANPQLAKLAAEHPQLAQMAAANPQLAQKMLAANPRIVQMAGAHAASAHGGISGIAAAHTSLAHAAATHGMLAQKVIQAAEQAFARGVSIALILAGAILLAAAIIAWFTMKPVALKQAPPSVTA